MSNIAKAKLYKEAFDLLKQAQELLIAARKKHEQQPAEGEEIMVNTPYDVFILPLRPSGFDGKGPRFVVHVPGPERPAIHPAITHCDNCGCDWLDNGLNPVGCPYCKQRATATLQAEVEALRAERDALAKDSARYAIARRMSPQQWAYAWELNHRTGKPFDEIIDDLAPFFDAAVAGREGEG